MTLVGQALLEAYLENVLFCGPLIGLSNADGDLGPRCSKYGPWRAILTSPESMLGMQNLRFRKS